MYKYTYPYSRNNCSVFVAGSNYFENRFPTAWQPVLSDKSFAQRNCKATSSSVCIKESLHAAVTNYYLLCRITWCCEQMAGTLLSTTQQAYLPWLHTARGIPRTASYGAVLAETMASTSCPAGKEIYGTIKFTTVLTPRRWTRSLHTRIQFTLWNHNSLISFFMPSSDMTSGLLSGFFLLSSTGIPCALLISPLCSTCHTHSAFSWSPKYYLVKIKSRETTNYVIFCGFLLLFFLQSHYCP